MKLSKLIRQLRKEVAVKVQEIEHRDELLDLARTDWKDTRAGITYVRNMHKPERRRRPYGRPDAGELWCVICDTKRHPCPTRIALDKVLAKQLERRAA